MASLITLLRVQLKTSSLPTLSTVLAWSVRRERLSVAAIGLLGFAGCLAVGLLVGVSDPKFHDEFSYLLAADTFAQGRITNPTHPMWPHFESFHIIHQPSYMSKYPPGQGIILATGQVLTGHPIVGVWLSFGLMCAAITWMLYAWVSPRWAVLGGIFAMINPVLGIAGYWAQSYWGGAMAATGGALMLGGIRRLLRQPRMTTSLTTGLGLAILANSRPFEGLLVSLPAGIFVLLHIINQRGWELWLSIQRTVVPLVVVVVLMIIGMASYNLGTTGNPFRLPYQIHERTYGMTPLFLLQGPPREPKYRHKVIQEFHKSYALPFYTNQRSIPGFLVENIYALVALAFGAINIFFIPLILGSSVLLPWLWRDPWGRRALLFYVLLISGLLVETFKWLHYLAPITCLNYYLVVTALRLKRWRNRKIGQLLLWLTPAVAIAALGISLQTTIAKGRKYSWHTERTLLLKQLQQKDGQHLVVVKYGPEHSVHNEWVYNKADIDNAKVVFGRAINSQQDCRLIEYFKSRQIWSLEIDTDQSPPRLTPYPRRLCQ